MQNNKKQKEDVPGLHLYFREIYNKSYGELIGYQTQMDVIDKELGVLEPNRYVPIAEISNQCVRLAHWQAEIICRLLPGLEKVGKQHDWIAMYVSGVAMEKPGFAAGLIDVIEKMECKVSEFAFELPASALDQIGENSLENIEQLREKGAKIIIRDYGVAYSAVMKLCQVPVDYCIIEQSLAKYMVGNDAEKSMYKNLIKMITDMGIEVVSDGVDKKVILDAWKENFDSCNAIGKKIGTWFDEDKLGVNRRTLENIQIDEDE